MFDIRKLAVVLTLAALVACDRPAPAPTKPSPVRPSERWQSVRLPTSEFCNEVACLFTLSGRDRPTIVSVRLIPLPVLRGDQRCRPVGLAPGLDDAAASTEAWLSEARTLSIPLACSAFGTPARFQLWRRSDHRYPFEAQKALAYGFIPAGSEDGADGRRIRCAIIFDPSAAPWEREIPRLRQAAEICAVLFYFREDG